MDAPQSRRIATLADRGVVRVTGAEADDFLQNLVTSDIHRADGEACGYGALLSPQGKILFDFLVLRGDGGFLFDLPRALAADFARRLGFYKLRAKVEIADLSSSRIVRAAWGGGDAPAHPGVVAGDARLPGLGWRIVTAAPAPLPGWEDATLADYLGHRIALGLPEGGADFAYGEAYPHDAGLDRLGGVDFKKGCYIGQEVVSRMEHRGSGRRRIVSVAASTPLPAAGTEITAGGRPLGTLGSSAGNAGLALVRLDRAAKARADGLPILAGEVPVVLAIPAWVGADWPEADAAE